MSDFDGKPVKDKAQDAAGVVSGDGRNHLPTSAVAVALATAFYVVGQEACQEQ